MILLAIKIFIIILIIIWVMDTLIRLGELFSDWLERRGR